MERGEATGRVIGIVDQEGSATLVDRIADLLARTDTDIVTGAPAEILDADPAVIVAPGERAVLAIARTGTTIPILPLAADKGIRSIPERGLEAAVEALVNDAVRTVERHRYGVRVGETDVGTAIADVMLVTEDPARISEYSVHVDGHDVAQFRADGIVVATPMGSRGYAEAASGPTLAPGTGVVAVPIAQFATDRDSWVLDGTTPIRLCIERDDGPVELLVDDRRHGIVDADHDVTLTRTTPLRLANVPASDPCWPE